MPTLFHRFAASVREINEKYKTPRIKTTWGVKFALAALRVYLLVLVGIMIFKFCTSLVA